MKTRFAFGVLVALVMAGCTTTGHFRIPPGTQLYVDHRSEPVELSDDGTVTTSPFFWSTIDGIPYRLERNGEVVQKGELKSKFRVVSIFWPPYAVIYWPVGFVETKTYDLTQR